MDIRSEYLSFAAEEGSATAIRGLEDIRDSLESILEVGSLEEKSAASLLLSNVNMAIMDILQVVQK